LARQYAAYVGEEPVGIMLGMSSPDIASDTKQALECLWQVTPAYRNTGAGPQLMRMFEEDARAAGCARIIFGASTEYRYDLMVRLYKRLGYKPISLTMAKNL
jgi:GNAT superfamily N-acetyltransferase